MKNNELIELFESKLHEVNVSKGDIIQFSIDSTRLLLLAIRDYGFEGVKGRDSFLYDLTECLKGIVGSNGTILIPTFTWKFNEGMRYSRKNTPSEVGAYSNWLLQHGLGFVRTRHPIHSFLVWGRDQDLYMNLDNTDSWGEDSPFSVLANSDAKLVVYDMRTIYALTIFHYVEEKLRVPYKYTKYFKGVYEDYDGTESERVISMYVRDLDIVPLWYYVFEEDFFRTIKSARYAELKGQSVASFLFRDIVRAIEDDFISNEGRNCINIEGYTFALNGAPTHNDDLSAIL